MLLFKKVKKPILRYLIFFITILYLLPIYANTLTELINSVTGNENQFCDETACFFPGKLPISDDIIVEEQINWFKDKNLVLHTKGNIVFKKAGKIISENNGSIILKAGMEPGKREIYDNTVRFEGDAVQIETKGNGKVKIYYNPIRGNKQHKYHNPDHYYYGQHIKAKDDKNFHSYMLVNDALDLQHIRAFLSGSYALSQDIDATKTKRWYKGKGFIPLKYKEKEDMPFSGNFDGNNYSIVGLFIYRPDEEEVGLFGGCYGRNIAHNVVENLTLKDFDITGKYYVGSLAGVVVNSDLLNIKVINPKIKSADIAGGLIGSAYKTQAEFIKVSNAEIDTKKDKNKGIIAGAVGKSKINLYFETKSIKDAALESYQQFLGDHDEETQLCFKGGDDPTICLPTYQQNHDIKYL